MRKIKFRLWDIEEKCFMNHSRVIESRVLALENNGEGRFIFQQWTGLLDRQGREIYEGDLYSYTVTMSFGFGEKYIDYIKQITFENGAFYHGEELLSDVIAYDDTFIYVGNIYENPELLEETK